VSRQQPRVDFVPVIYNSNGEEVVSDVFGSTRLSCTTQLLFAMDNWIEALQQGIPIDVVYLDFSKAFDAVPHQRLLVKLKAYGVQGKLLNWIKLF